MYVFDAACRRSFRWLTVRRGADDADAMTLREQAAARKCLTSASRVIRSSNSDITIAPQYFDAIFRRSRD